MGATNWRYYTPYRPDPEDALQALRQEVFARGDYVNLTGSIENQLRETYRRFGEDPDSPAVQARINEALRLQHSIDTGDDTGLSRSERGFTRRARMFGWLARLLGAAPPPPPRNGPFNTIEELLEAAEESGTHSILDIEHTAPRPSFGVAAPLSTRRRTQLFNTNEPTHAQVETHWPTIAEPLQRWHCRYLIVYLDGQPNEYAFIGCSGD